MKTRAQQRQPLDLHRVAAERGVKLMTGEELVEMIEKICEGMSPEEREAFADKLDSVWRGNGRVD